MELGVTANENKVSLGEEKKCSRIRCGDRGSAVPWKLT